MRPILKVLKDCLSVFRIEGVNPLGVDRKSDLFAHTEAQVRIHPGRQGGSTHVQLQENIRTHGLDKLDPCLERIIRSSVASELEVLRADPESNLAADKRPQAVRAS